jgi:pyruvate kinase
MHHSIRRTKIVSTLGPATSSAEQISELIDAGVDMFRLNASHGTLEWHKERINIIKTLRKELNKPIPIMFDIQGPKIRVGELENGGPVELIEGQEICITPECIKGTSKCISTNYSNLSVDVAPGNNILLDDGIFNLQVTAIEGKNVIAKVIAGGLLKERKGVNIPGSTGSLSAIGEKDQKDIAFAVENDVDYIAMSFVRSANDIIHLKEYIKNSNGDIPVIAKIEKPEALDNIKDIINQSDGIMVARGDLGIELAPQKVPVAQKKLIKLANKNNKFVITATQMLESMVNNPLPSRAEASDVANAIIDGTDAIMLSAETSVGKYPVKSVKTMGLIASEIESSKEVCIKNIIPEIQGDVSRDSHAISLSAVDMSKDLDPDAIVVFTNSGYSARLISKFKPSIPVIAITHQQKVCNQLNICWSLKPYVLDIDSFDEEVLESINELLKEKTFLNKGDTIILVGGMPFLVSGITNFIRICIIK